MERRAFIVLLFFVSPISIESPVSKTNSPIIRTEYRGKFISFNISRN